MKDKPKVSNSAVFREEGDEAFLFNPDTGDIKILNSTGVFIWKLCDGKHTKKDMTNKIVDNFDDIESKIAVEEDLNRFLEDLGKGGLVINRKK